MRSFVEIRDRVCFLILNLAPCTPGLTHSLPASSPREAMGEESDRTTSWWRRRFLPPHRPEEKESEELLPVPRPTRHSSQRARDVISRTIATICGGSSLHVFLCLCGSYRCFLAGETNSYILHQPPYPVRYF